MRDEEFVAALTRLMQVSMLPFGWKVERASARSLLEESSSIRVTSRWGDKWTVTVERKS